MVTSHIWKQLYLASVVRCHYFSTIWSVFIDHSAAVMLCQDHLVYTWQLQESIIIHILLQEVLNRYLQICILKGYECIKILIAMRLIILNGVKIYNEGAALNLKRVFPLFSTTNVCGERKRQRQRERLTLQAVISLMLSKLLTTVTLIKIINSIS